MLSKKEIPFEHKNESRNSTQSSQQSSSSLFTADSQSSQFFTNFEGLNDSVNLQDVQVIDKMRSGISLGEMRNKDIVDLYEYKLATLHTKQAHLQSQLEAKDLSLQQAERINAQVRCKLADSETICQNLNSTIKQLHNKLACENSKISTLQSKEKELLDRQTNYMKDLENLQILTQKYSKLSLDIERKNEACNQLQTHLDRKSSQLESLRKSKEVSEVNVETLKGQQQRHFEQIKSLEIEKQKLKQKLNDKETLNKEIETNLYRIKTLNYQSERNELELIAERDNVIKQLTLSQKNNEDMHSQLCLLKSENTRFANELKTANNENSLMKSQLDRMKQLASMIHNLNSNSNSSNNV